MAADSVSARVGTDAHQQGVAVRQVNRAHLLEGLVGALMRLYERSQYAEALLAFERLTALYESLAKATSARNLLDLYRLNQRPIATKLDNRRSMAR